MTNELLQSMQSSRAVELVSKNFPQLLDEYEETIATQGESFSLQGALKLDNLLLFISLLFWFYVFYQLIVNASALPVWATVLSFYALFFMPAGSLLALIVLFYFLYYA